MKYKQYLKFGHDGIERKIAARDDLKTLGTAAITESTFRVKLEDGNTYELIIDELSKIPKTQGRVFYFNATGIKIVGDNQIAIKAGGGCSGILIF